MEFYLSPNLISKEEWQKRIRALRDEVAGMSQPPVEELKTAWVTAFEHAVLARAKGKVGVLFSGGVDSTFIAYVLHKHKIPFVCYTVGFKDVRTKLPDDVIASQRVIEKYGWPHRLRMFTETELQPVVDEAISILKEHANPVTVGVGAVVIAAARLAAEDHIHTLFGGLGSEEIFAGYERHEKASAINDECWRGMMEMYDRDMVRDFLIGKALGISVPTPFMDQIVIKLAMLFPDSQKIVGDDKKYVLRVMAQEYGLEKEFAFRPKRAAQYGSRINKGILRLAKNKGMLKKGEYIVSLGGSPSRSAKDIPTKAFGN